MEDVQVFVVEEQPGVDTVQLVLTELLCHLHALYFVERSIHWQISSNSYYGDHLMFQRMYEVLDDEIDKIGEKVVNCCGAAAVDADILAQGTNDLVQMYICEERDPFDRALRAESELLACVDEVANTLDEHDKLTLGWEDVLGGLASQHEDHIYLLGRRVDVTHR